MSQLDDGQSAANARGVDYPTPRPWKIRTDRDGVISVESDGHLVAVERVGHEDAARALADAELIVAAVNAYHQESESNG